MREIKLRRTKVVIKLESDDLQASVEQARAGVEQAKQRFWLPGQLSRMQRQVFRTLKQNQDTEADIEKGLGRLWKRQRVEARPLRQLFH